MGSEMGKRMRPAFYALAPGSWRDYLTILHPPYTVWHLSYVVLGAALSPTLHLERLGGTLLAFFLAVGVGAHALDEFKGRPLGTHIPDRVLIVMAAASIGGAIALGVIGSIAIDVRLLAFTLFGGFIVIAYNLELFAGRFHNDFWFAAAWGSFPMITAYWINAGNVTLGAGAVATLCFLASAVQRVLSKRVRRLRRGVWEGRAVAGIAQEEMGATLIVPERALKLLNLGVILAAIGVFFYRL